MCLGFESCESLISEGVQSVGVFVLFPFFGVLKLKRRPSKQDTIVAGGPEPGQIIFIGPAYCHK